MKNTVILIIVSFLTWSLFFKTEESVRYGPGVLVPESPIQQNQAFDRGILFKDYKITPLAHFSMRAKVLSKKNYYFGKEADLSPTDLALGWGRMSDESILKSITISQSGRWYRWRASSLPIPKREIETHSANMHIIPSNQMVADTLKRVRNGNLINLTGKLVRIDSSDGWHWTSSLTRNDRGQGACELILVEHMEIETI